MLSTEKELQTLPALVAVLASWCRERGVALREKIDLLRASLEGSRLCKFKGIVRSCCGFPSALYSQHANHHATDTLEHAFLRSDSESGTLDLEFSMIHLVSNYV